MILNKNTFGFIIVAIFMVAFMVAGVIILGERQLVPNGVDLISAQKNIYSVINPFVGNYLYPIAIVVVIRWFNICRDGCDSKND
jgi:K+ transporter